MRSRTLRLMMAMAFSVVSLVALAPVARADDSYTGTCSLAISPLTASAGQTVTITGKGFNAGAEVTFTIDTTPPVVLGTATADSSGVAGGATFRALPSPLKSSGTLAMDIPGLLYGRPETQR